MKIILGFVLITSLFVVSVPVFSAETKREGENVAQDQKEKKQYFYCAQTPSFSGFYVFMSGIFIVEDTNEPPLRTLEKVEEHCKKEFKKNRSTVSVVITAFNRIDQ